MNGNPFSVQLALQGGGAKICGLLAAAETIQELRREGRLAVTRTAGTSAGAIVAALIATDQPIGPIRDRLKRMSDPEWSRVFPEVGWVRVLWSISRGRPIMNEFRLSKLLEEFFDKQEFRTFDDLKRKSGIDVFVVAADVTDGRKRVFGGSERIVTSLLHSCGLPFVFRTGSQPPVLVDGGICENLPAEELGGEQERSKFGAVVGISFRPEGARSAAKFWELGKGLLETAMGNSMERARRQLGEENIFTVNTELGTFDFGRARSHGFGVEYDKIRLEARDWFDPLLKRVEKPERIVVGTQEAPEVMQRSLSKVYAAQHMNRPLKFREVRLEISAFSLLPNEPGERPDEISEEASFEPAGECVDCYRLGLSTSSLGRLGPLSTLRVTDGREEPLSYTMVPSLSEQDTEGHRVRECLLFFDPPIRPSEADDGRLPYKVVLRDQVFGGMSGLIVGEDYMAFTLKRAPTGPVPTYLVLHVPDSFRALEMSAPPGDHPRGVLGRPMTPVELAKFRSPVGFKALGWAGEIGQLGGRLAVRFR